MPAGILESRGTAVRLPGGLKPFPYGQNSLGQGLPGQQVTQGEPLGQQYLTQPAGAASAGAVER